MPKYYIAITFDVCEHNNFYLDMNEYPIKCTDNLAEQVQELAGIDIAPVVKVYESDASDFTNLKLYKEYKFKEYECNCENGGSV